MSDQPPFSRTPSSVQAGARVSGTNAQVTTRNLKRPISNETPNLSCPQHDVNYVLRHNRRDDPTMLIYECPVEGCLNTYQERVKR